MAGPTEILTDDVKSLREDLRKVELSLTGSIHKIELDVRELSTQIKGLLTAIKLLSLLAVTSLAGSIWWGATLTNEIKHVSENTTRIIRVVEASHIEVGPVPRNSPDPLNPPELRKP